MTKQTIAATRKMVKPRWRDNLLVIGGTIVGTVMQGAGVRGAWFAHGCMSDWEDTPLGHHETERKAQKAVEAWVRDHSES